MRYLTPLLFVSLVLFAPALTYGQGFVTCSGADCDLCDLFSTIWRVIDFIYVTISIIAVFVLAYAGFKLVTSAGNQNAWTEAKQFLQNVIIGIILIFASYVIVDTLIKAVVGGDHQYLNFADRPMADCGGQTTPVGQDNPPERATGGPQAILIYDPPSPFNDNTPTLSWQTANATTVTINNQPQPATGSMSLPTNTQQTFTIVATGDDDRTTSYDLAVDTTSTQRQTVGSVGGGSAGGTPSCVHGTGGNYHLRFGSTVDVAQLESHIYSRSFGRTDIGPYNPTLGERHGLAFQSASPSNRTTLRFRMVRGAIIGLPTITIRNAAGDILYENSGVETNVKYILFTWDGRPFPNMTSLSRNYLFLCAGETYIFEPSLRNVAEGENADWFRAYGELLRDPNHWTGWNNLFTQPPTDAYLQNPLAPPTTPPPPSGRAPNPNSIQSQLDPIIQNYRSYVTSLQSTVRIFEDAQGIIQSCDGANLSVPNQISTAYNNARSELARVEPILQRLQNAHTRIYNEAESQEEQWEIFATVENTPLVSTADRNRFTTEQAGARQALDNLRREAAQVCG